MEYKRSYYTLCSIIKQELNKLRNDSWSSNLMCINQHSITTKNNDKLFKFIKIIKNNNKSIPPLKSGNTVLLSSEEKCKAIKDQLVKSHLVTHHLISPLERKVVSKVRQFLNCNQHPIITPSILCKTRDKKK